MRVMRDLEDSLGRWRRAGIIDQAAAQRILEFERDQEQPAGEEPGGRPGAVEAFIYLGLLVLAIGVFSIAASVWEELAGWARVALVGVPMLLMLGLGAVLRASPDAATRRGGEMAWFVSVGLAAGLVLVLGDEYGSGVDSPGVRLTAGTTAFLYALCLWALRPGHFQIVAVAGALAFFAQMLGSWPDEFNQRLAGLGLMVPAAAALAATEVRRLFPAAAARLAFAAALVGGGLEMQTWSSWYWEPWAMAAGAGLVALSLRRDSFIYMAVGMGGIFFGLVFAVSEHLADRIGAQLAFTLSGAIIIGGALVIAQLSKRFRAEPR